MGSMKSKKIIALAKGVWAFCSYLFIPQRRPKIKPIQEFWYMEGPSCTEWALNTAMNRFQPNTWVEVGKEGVEVKVKALGMYRGVMRPYLHPRSAEAIVGFAAYQGCQAGCVYAEAFEVVLRRY